MRLVFLLALVGTAMAAPRNQQRIVGGSPATIEQYPYMSNMLFLMFGWSWTQSCGGSLLTSQTILSAAHCYLGDQASEWRVRLGSTMINTGGDIHLVTRLLLHPGYDSSTIDNDVAIITMASPALFSESIGTARIAGSNYILPDGTTVTAVGWGTLAAGGTFPWDLQHVDFHLINQEICAERYAYLKTLPNYQNWPDVTPGMLCTGILDVGGKDTCQGDSGGPVAHNGDIIVGVTSWGFSCAHSVYPSVNARVSHYADWIVANG